MKPREWCAYVRVSRVKGREGDKFHSPDEQAERIKGSTKDKCVQVFEDLDVSGGTWERKGLDAAVAWMQRSPQRRGMIVMDIDRLGRDMHGSLTFIKSMDSQGLKVRVLDQEIETDDPDGMLKWQMLMAIAEYYRKKTSERWLSIHERRRKEGRPASGIARFGYKRLGKDETQTIKSKGKEVLLKEGDFVPDEATKGLLRWAYKQYTAGDGYQKLVKRFNDEGVLTGRSKPWSTHSLRRTLDSGFAAGLLRLSDGTQREGRHEPILSAD